MAKESYRFMKPMPNINKGHSEKVNQETCKQLLSGNCKSKTQCSMERIYEITSAI